MFTVLLRLLHALTYVQEVFTMIYQYHRIIISYLWLKYTRESPILVQAMLIYICVQMQLKLNIEMGESTQYSAARCNVTKRMKPLKTIELIC